MRIVDHFWDFKEIDQQTGCWNWTRALDKGYARLRDGEKLYKVSRISWEFYNKRKIPKNFIIRHKCDNTACINPDHLEIGTKKDNMHDCISRGRRNFARGSRCRHSALTVEKVKKIREICTNRSRTYKDIANQFGVTESAIQQIDKRQTWKHID